MLGILLEWLIGLSPMVLKVVQDKSLSALTGNVNNTGLIEVPWVQLYAKLYLI